MTEALLFVREDWELFRNLQTLAQKAGVPVSEIGKIVAKELVDNALDAIEGQPDGVVTIDLIGSNGIVVEDTGKGVPVDQLPDLFSIKRGLASSKLLRLPTRGALGNGLRVVTGAVLATGGSLRVGTRGQLVELIPQDDGETHLQSLGAYPQSGMRVEVTLGMDVPSDTLTYARQAILFRQGEHYRGKTSPYWYDSDSFYELVRSAGERPIRDLFTAFDGCTGAKAGQITSGFYGRACASLTRTEAEALLHRAREQAKPVSAKRLGRIGDGWMPDCSYAASDYYTLTLKPAIGALAASLPVIVEAWVWPGPACFLTLVNKTPVTTFTWAQKTKDELLLAASGFQIGSFKVGRTSYQVFVNIQTPYMPILSDGKSPDLTAFNRSIQDVVGRAIRKAKRGMTGKPSAERLTQKEVVFDRMEEATHQASGGGQYRFSQRQLFYAIRPVLIETFRIEPNYDTFAAILTEYEALYGDLPGLYRDPRGTVYHPHLHQEFPLGTLEVEAYQRPDWTFNKVLYSEKEGFFSILKAEGWPEQHDCALLTSKGQASRAAKDLIDRLGDTGEELLFFCIHDADASGTMIYQSLQEETRARPGRRVKVINLGLDPDEALGLGLQVEKTSYKKVQPVANYLPASVAEWLQSHRVELNAMTTEMFIRWLNDKMAQYGNGKLQPPDRVTGAELTDRVRVRLREAVQVQVLKTAQFEEQASEALRQMTPVVDQVAGGLAERIQRDLEARPERFWRSVVDQVAADVVSQWKG